MAKFKVGDRVRCARVDLGFCGLKADIGTVEKIGEEHGKYWVVCDNATGGWWYGENQLTAIETFTLTFPTFPIPQSVATSARITTIEWYTPDENLPYDGAKVFWVCAGQFCGGEYRGDDFYTVDDWYNSADQIDLWAYAPEVK